MWDKIQAWCFNRFIGLDKEAMDDIKAKALAKAINEANEITPIAAPFTKDPKAVVYTAPNGDKITLTGKDNNGAALKYHVESLEAKEKSLEKKLRKQKEETKMWKDTAGKKVDDIMEMQKEIDRLKKENVLQCEKSGYDSPMKGMEL